MPLIEIMAENHQRFLEICNDYEINPRDARFVALPEEKRVLIVTPPVSLIPLEESDSIVEKYIPCTTIGNF